MYPVPGRCPVCGEELSVTRMHCNQCDLTLEGAFRLSRFSRLTAEQLRFVELFVECEGKLNKLQAELGLSYPTVRARLDDVIDALRVDKDAARALPAEQRQAILSDLAASKISPQEAIELLQRP